MAWKGDSQRHALARSGIKTKIGKVSNLKPPKSHNRVDLNQLSVEEEKQVVGLARMYNQTIHFVETGDDSTDEEREDTIASIKIIDDSWDKLTPRMKEKVWEKLDDDAKHFLKYRKGF